MTQLKMRQNGSDRIWTLSYGLDTGINFLLYVVHFELMLWSASYVLDRWHGSLSEAGMASGIFIVGALAARIPAGRYIDFFGRKRLLLVGTLLYFLLLLLYTAVPTAEAFMAVRFFHGMAFGLSSTAASTIAAAVLPVKRLGEGIGYYTLGVTLASAAGPFLAISFQNSSVAARDACLLSAGLGALLAWLVYPPECALTKEAKEKMKSLAPEDFFAVPAFRIALISMVGGICYSAVLAFLETYGNEAGLSGYGTVLFFPCFALTSFLSRPLTGRLLDRKGGDIVLYPALALMGAAMVLIGCAHTGDDLLRGALLLGLGYGTITAACHALAIYCVPADQVGVATSTYFVMLDAGIGAGPYLLGSIATMWGFPVLYLFAGVVSFAGIGLYWMLLGRCGRFTAARLAIDRARKTRMAREH